ncbi:UPF0390 protein zgc136864-like [Branchiostoma floridae]|uniref:UPF0390 protein zgc136864-like n=1 Tax=Branchiostoma floridae TaxID=7739 RepID=A0A9J7LPQ9_BRAFL|nr:UPF0390 protein zgc136864-like [Branchiostoma floridae]
MAQGKLKVKTKLPAGAKKQKQRPKKPLGPKKGARQIAPKKNKIVQAVKLQKGLEKELRMNIEQEMSSRASREGKPFTVAGLSQDSSSKDSKK